MLQDIRNNAQGTIAKVIIGLLIVSLSIWGMDAIVGGFSGEPEVATVNGEDITEREFLRVVQMESQRRLSRMENPDPSMLDEDQIRTDVLDSLIQEQVLIQDANAQGLELNDADIDALITQMPQFQVDGQFNRDRFVATVRNMGMGVGEFREAMRKQYVVNQIRAGIVQSGLVADENAEQLLQIQNQTRSFRVLDIPASSVADAVSVSDADVEAFYEENSGAFQQPERVDAAYITLSLGALAESIEVDDAELQAYYEQQAADLASEERRASHILIEEGSDADETMATIQERLAAGESFADLAREYSIDTVSAEDGGDLGYAGRGIYAEPFEEALFALEEGEVSEPVRTSFGVHLIRLEDVRESEVPSLDEMEDQLRRELAREKTEVLLKRYPETVSIWSASDGMALGAIEAARNAGRVPGQDLLVGSVDWQPEALDKIRSGELLVSLGRHFMGGGLALLLLHDYHHGRDFDDMSPDYVFRYKLEPATRDNIDQVQRIADPENWSSVDFRQFSRVGETETAKAVPDPDAVLDAITGALARQETGSVASRE